MNAAKISKCPMYIGDIFKEYKVPNGIEALICKKAETKEDKKLLSLAKDLMNKLLDLNFKTRVNAEQALKHEFFKGVEDKIKERLKEINKEK